MHKHQVMRVRSFNLACVRSIRMCFYYKCVKLQVRVPVLVFASRIEFCFRGASCSAAHSRVLYPASAFYKCRSMRHRLKENSPGPASIACVFRGICILACATTRPFVRSRCPSQTNRLQSVTNRSTKKHARLTSLTERPSP